VRPNGSSTDTTFEYKDCDFTSQIDAHWNGTEICTTPTYSGYSSSYNYSGDGWATYDIDNDGKSWLPSKQLYGSPFIY
jgi:hypothetical protein